MGLCWPSASSPADLARPAGIAGLTGLGRLRFHPTFHQTFRLKRRRIFLIGARFAARVFHFLSYQLRLEQPCRQRACFAFGMGAAKVGSLLRSSIMCFRLAVSARKA